MNPKHIIDDTIPKIAPNIKAIFDFVGPERSTDIFELKVIFILEKDLCLDTRGDVSLSKLRESKFFFMYFGTVLIERNSGMRTLLNNS